MAKHGRRKHDRSLDAGVLPPRYAREGSSTPAFQVTAGDLAGVAYWPWHIDAQAALGLSAVARCVSVIAGSVSRLPWSEWDGLDRLPVSRLVDRPAAQMTRREWTWRVCSTLALENVCHLLLVGGEDDEGVPWSLIPVPAQAISPADMVDPWGMAPPTSYYIAGETVSAESLVILRRAPWGGIPDHLSSILKLARTAFGAAIAADTYAARYWEHGGSPVTVITGPGKVTNNDQADAIAERWRYKRSLGPDHPVVLGDGATAAPFGADATAASAVEARRELVADIARFFGVPTRLVNAPANDDETYANVESEGLDLIRYCLGDYIGAVEDAITGLLPDERRMVLDPTPLTRGLQQDRYQAWSTALGQQPWITPAEVREAEHLPPIEPAALARTPAPAPAPSSPLEDAGGGADLADEPVAAGV